MNPTFLPDAPVEMPAPPEGHVAPGVTDAALAAECEELSAGMMTQASASNSGSPLAGHPHPAFFYGKVAAVLKAAAVRLRSIVPPGHPTVAPPPKHPVSDAPFVPEPPPGGKSGGKSGR